MTNRLLALGSVNTDLDLVYGKDVIFFPLEKLILDAAPERVTLTDKDDANTDDTVLLTAEVSCLVTLNTPELLAVAKTDDEVSCLATLNTPELLTIA